jgi:hypothetical protein
MITGAKVKTDRRDAFALAKLKRCRIRHLFFTMLYSAAFARIRKVERKGEEKVIVARCLLMLSISLR